MKKKPRLKMLRVNRLKSVWCPPEQIQNRMEWDLELMLNSFQEAQVSIAWWVVILTLPYSAGMLYVKLKDLMEWVEGQLTFAGERRHALVQMELSLFTREEQRVPTTATKVEQQIFYAFQKILNFFLPRMEVIVLICFRWSIKLTQDPTSRTCMTMMYHVPPAFQPKEAQRLWYQGE